MCPIANSLFPNNPIFTGKITFIFKISVTNGNHEDYHHKEFANRKHQDEKM